MSRMSELDMDRQLITSFEPPVNDTEVAIEMRLVGLFSATKTLQGLIREAEGREIIARPKCVEEIEMVRDALSRILDKVGGKHV